MISSIQSGGSSAITAPKHRNRFAKMDKNGDGTLDVNELAGMAKRTGKDASQLLAELDTNKDGKVDSGEMAAAMAKKGSGAGSGQPDGSQGAASQFTTALMNILKQVQGSDGSSDGSDAFSQMDANGDGQISKSEFEAGTAKQKDASNQNLNGAATEFTSALMNLFKQLQDSGNGSSQTASSDGSSSGQSGNVNPVTGAVANDGTPKTTGSDDLLAQFQAAVKGDYSFSQSTMEMTTLQSIG